MVKTARAAKGELREFLIARSTPCRVNPADIDAWVGLYKKPHADGSTPNPQPGDAAALAAALARLGPITDSIAMGALGWGGTRVWQAMQAPVGRAEAVYDCRGCAVIQSPAEANERSRITSRTHTTRCCRSATQTNIDGSRFETSFTARSCELLFLTRKQPRSIVMGLPMSYKPALAMYALLAPIISFNIEKAIAAEQAKNVYLLGSNTSLSGVVPEPGLYVSSLYYFYTGDATGAAAISRSLPLQGRTLPSTPTLQLNARTSVSSSVSLDALSVLWVAPDPVLGGRLGIGGLLPVGYQTVDVDINARAALAFPHGPVLRRGATLSLNDSTVAVGDPMATAFLGWDNGNWHWKISGLLNIPIGSYDRNNLAKMGFNRWAADVTVAATWLDPNVGFEVSSAAGFTFNGENPATNYRTGTEFHLEGAVMQHFSKEVAIGAVGYYYRQVTGDSGTGAVLGPFKGEVAAIGPSLSYNIQLGSVPVFTSLRWLHEFDAKNRLQGDAAFLTVTVPLGGPAKQN